MPKAVYLDIYQDIKGLIESGELPYQSFLPSEHALTRRYSCSRSSIRRALGQLAADGYVQSQQGKGVRVIRDPTLDVSRGYDGLETFTEMGRRLGFSTETRPIALERLTADRKLATLTGFDEGSGLTRILRARVANKEPVSVDESYYLSDAVEGITLEDVASGVYRYLEEVRGVKIATSRRIITVEAAGGQDRKLIALGDFNAVAVSRSHTFDNEGVLVEYTESRQHPSFFSQYVTVIRAAR